MERKIVGNALEHFDGRKFKMRQVGDLGLGTGEEVWFGVRVSIYMGRLTAMMWGWLGRSR